MEEKLNSPFHQGKMEPQRVMEDNGLLFPMVLLPFPSQDKMTLHAFLQTIRNNREWIDHHLKEVGALLFRGFPVKTASDFNEVVEALGWEEQPYVGAATRTKIQGRVYTANEAPLNQPINFHHEMSLYKDFPTKLVFFCEVAPPEGGQTGIVISHKITERMEQKYPELVKKMEEEGLLYSSCMPEEDDPDCFYQGWQSFFQTKDTEEAERKAADSMLKWKVSWEGRRMMLQIGPIDSIVSFEGNNKKKAWFNQLALANIKKPQMLGDGTLVPKEAIESCIQIAEEESVDVKWEVGDVVVLDNRIVQHARRPSQPPRRVLAAFCK